MDAKDTKTEEQQYEKKSNEIEEVKKEEENSVHLQTELKNCEDKYKRAIADYQNLQRYTEEQRIVWVRQASRDVILKMLVVLDTLELTVKHFTEKSLQLAIDQFLKVLQEEGVTKIKTIGQKFNPSIMECITTQDTGADEGKVLKEVRSGYMLYDIVLRTAQVIVGKANISSYKE